MKTLFISIIVYLFSSNITVAQDNAPKKHPGGSCANKNSGCLKVINLPHRGSAVNDVFGSSKNDFSKKEQSDKSKKEEKPAPKGIISVEEKHIKISGDISYAFPQVLFKRLKKVFLFCYQRELNNHHKLAGQISISFAIGKTHKPYKPKITHSTINNKNVEQCILKVPGRFRFPKHPNNQEVTIIFPMTFQPATP
jgi:hypothetical protein